ncbi:MAG: hypothetical protein J6R79_06845 [Bacteroidaceae bacterium]|nr:hypothetical protein [Bacteroidaceae bacterium]
MKKIYAKPQVNEVLFQTQGVIATSMSFVDDEVNTNDSQLQFTETIDDWSNSIDWE